MDLRPSDEARFGRALRRDLGGEPVALWVGGRTGANPALAQWMLWAPALLGIVLVLATTGLFLWVLAPVASIISQLVSPRRILAVTDRGIALYRRSIVDDGIRPAGRYGLAAVTGVEVQAGRWRIALGTGPDATHVWLTAEHAAILGMTLQRRLDALPGGLRLPAPVHVPVATPA